MELLNDPVIPGSLAARGDQEFISVDSDTLWNDPFFVEDDSI